MMGIEIKVTKDIKWYIAYVKLECTHYYLIYYYKVYYLILGWISNGIW